MSEDRIKQLEENVKELQQILTLIITDKYRLDPLTANADAAIEGFSYNDLLEYNHEEKGWELKND